MGTGYGMPLMKSYMRNLGGDISVVSQTIDKDPFDHGTTVICFFDQLEKIEKGHPTVPDLLDDAIEMAEI